MTMVRSLRPRPSKLAKGQVPDCLVDGGGVLRDWGAPRRGLKKARLT